MKVTNGYIMAAGAFSLIGVALAYLTGSVGVAQDATALPLQGSTAAQVEGSVSNVIEVPGYTYVEVETGDGTVWAAAPSVPVRVGDVVSFSTSMEKRDFYSKTLQRGFEIVYFVDQFISNDGTSSINSEAAAAHGSMSVGEAAQPVQGIRKADGGITVAEIFARGDEFDGQSVRVRGQAVKFTASVMGTNWLRIRDGSIESDLVIPTDITVAIGDIVLVEGKLAINLDLGQGYVLPAVLQDAEVTIER